MTNSQVSYSQSLQKFFKESPGKFLCVFVSPAQPSDSDNLKVIKFLSDIKKRAGLSPEGDIALVYSLDPKLEPIDFSEDIVEDGLEFNPHFNLIEYTLNKVNDDFFSFFDLNTQLSQEISGSNDAPNFQVPTLLIYNSPEVKPKVIPIPRVQALNDLIDKLNYLRSYLRDYEKTTKALSEIKNDIDSYESSLPPPEDSLNGTDAERSQIQQALEFARKKQDKFLNYHTTRISFRFQAELNDTVAHLKRIGPKGEIDQEILDFISKE